ncbi:hypothetical protein PVK06_014013 [Gossypium arboreum]|uniref:Integrase catalytic domain-containing protein n=1 Tax=Gossypium arboreum TaxID=29729 RepID=A0ABR0PTR1_GOSAR|nr:hypothetical protein PVK06_014013 [Gossypium arboreum]
MGNYLHPNSRRQFLELIQVKVRLTQIESQWLESKVMWTWYNSRLHEAPSKAMFWLFRVSLAKVAGLVVRIPAFLFEPLYVNPPSLSCPNFRKFWSLLLFEDP